MSSIPVEQAARQLDALVDAALAGDDVVLDRNGQSVRLVPVPVTLQGPLPQTSTWADLLKDFAGKAEGLPADMAENHDHYLHGAPKK